MPAKLTKKGDALLLDLSGCRGFEFTDAKDKIKDIPGRRWDPETKMWMVPADPQTADRILKTIQPHAEDDLLNWIKQAFSQHEESLTSPLPDDAELMIPWATERCDWQPEYVNDEKFDGALPYQRAAIDKIARVGRVILADDMGLGKTFEAISAVAERSLRCCYEAGALIQLGQEESGRASQALSSLLAGLQGSPQRLDPIREGEAMRGLWDRVAFGGDGPGSRTWGEVVFSGSVDEESDTLTLHFTRGGDLAGDSEVRGTLPQLSPHAALSLGPKLVVCPASVKGSWKRELKRWLPPETAVHVIEGSYPKTKNQTSDERRRAAVQAGIDEDAWIIINWEQLRIVKEVIATPNGGKRTIRRMKEPLYETQEWLAVIADEAHRAKNPKSLQSQGLWRVTGWVNIAATGTPLMNSPDELWSPMRWLWPGEYHELGKKKNAVAYWDFYESFVQYHEDHFKRKVITGVKNPDALRFVLKDKLIRRTSDILGLKGRKRITYPVALNKGQQALYNEAEVAMWLRVEEEVAEGNKAALDFARAAIEGGGMANLMRIPNGAARLVRLRQVIENAALLGGADDSAVMDNFEEKFVDSRPHQWVVFCAFKESCELLAERLRKKYGATVGVYNGDVKPAARTELEDKFQRGEIEVMIGTIDAMYQGITLTASRNQFWLSRDFVPAKNEQGEARNDRLGQQHLVLVYIPLADDTVAVDKVEPINRLKEAIVKTVLPQVAIQQGEHS